MTKIISIITPVHRAGVMHLDATFESVMAQHLPTGWTWEWLVQEDGEGVESADHLRPDPRIRVGSSRRGGPHVARTVALGRSSGELIKTLDSDDVLTEGTLARDIELLEERPEVGWVTSRVLDLLPDGSLRGFSDDPSEGIVPAGSVRTHWEMHRRPQVHPATMCARRHLVMALGGWMALPSSGDTGLLLGLDALAAGWFTSQVGLHYRKHAGQITAAPHHASGPEYEARMKVISEHARALHQLMGDASTRQETLVGGLG